MRRLLGLLLLLTVCPLALRAADDTGDLVPVGADHPQNRLFPGSRVYRVASKKKAAAPSMAPPASAARAANAWPQYSEWMTPVWVDLDRASVSQEKVPGTDKCNTLLTVQVGGSFRWTLAHVYGDGGFDSLRWCWVGQGVRMDIEYYWKDEYLADGDQSGLYVSPNVLTFDAPGPCGGSVASWRQDIGVPSLKGRYQYIGMYLHTYPSDHQARIPVLDPRGTTLQDMYLLVQ